MVTRGQYVLGMTLFEDGKGLSIPRSELLQGEVKKQENGNQKNESN